ncbi:Zinc finger in N-recognin family protein [Histomonas meleagridis]|uniref:Zinc finger in N-recognin family protein n=1 Tax=Histomonas meleagridis TaxID=135588 RepID=UPI003559D39E|nr:Zinc finger in N-recognin family protein [Histomonas meleagridis]KAH0803140.1 Zinc finger in N-recognin family protein [Histomonas meleagridis]
MSFVDTETNDEEVQEENNINHEKAQKLRENILNKFAQLQQHFNQKDQEENDNNNEDLNINQQKDTCCVCSINQENEVLCYPSFIIKTHLPLEFDGDKEWDAVYGFSICKHLSHDDCLPINCPIDRMLKNSFIPKLDNIKDFETETVKETLRKFKRIMDLDEDDNVNILANSLTSLIVTYEVRLRSNPACLDNDKYSIMARNLYLCIRQLVKMGDVLYDEYTKWTNFRHFICDLITAENPKDEIKNITKKCAGELNGKELTLFLKRVKLAEHFLLYNSSEHNSYIDWDEILSNENLCHEYEFEFNGEEYTFEPYKLINLPKNFFMLGKEPYNALNEIKNSQTQYYICLHNGKIIKENERLKALEENDYDPVPLMALNIKHTEPSFVFENRGRGMFYTQEPFYLDFLGNPDVGLNNMHLLYLSEEGYEHFVDRYLSADYIR